MIRAASLLRLKSRTTVIGLSLSSRVPATTVPQIPCLRFLHRSTYLQNNSPALDGLTFESPDELELVAPRSRPVKDFSGIKSLHVSRVHKEATDEEFRNAFASLEGLEKAELIFNSGAMRDYQQTSSRGFGFLHFTDEASALAAAKHLEQNPARVKGYETQINPAKSNSPTLAQESHTLHLAGLPLDLQYLEVVELLRGKNLGHKSIRFMTGQEQTFVGAINVIFNDTASAVSARNALLGATLGGMELRENDVKYGRPLWENGPTSTLMILGIPRESSAATRMREALAALEGVNRYKLLKDSRTGDFKGIAILDCDSQDEAWRLLEYLHRTYPAYRIAFIMDKNQYEKKIDDRPRREYNNDRPRREYNNDRPRREYNDRPRREYNNDRPRREYNNDRNDERPRSYNRRYDSEDSEQSRPTSYKRFQRNFGDNDRNGDDRGRY